MIVGGWRGPGWQVFDADPGRGKEVRDWVRHVIDSHDCPVDLDDVTLAVGELFANAVTYGPPGGQVLARLSLSSACAAGACRVSPVDPDVTGVCAPASQ